MSELYKVAEEDCVKWLNKEGKLHRVEGPAIEWIEGSRQWYLNGELHRVDGPAIEWASGRKEWWLNGIIHRLDGPAIEWSSGTKEWWVAGQRHRIDGPAIIRGNHYTWWQNGIEFSSKEEWFKALTIECQIAYLFKMEELK